MKARQFPKLASLLSALVMAALVASCSGGGNAGTPTAGPTPTAAPASDTDRAYAKSVCGAINRYITAFGAETQRDPQLFADQKKLLAVAAPILDSFSKDLQKAKPPKDVANFHNALVDKVGAIAKKAKSGQVVSTQELGNITKGAPLPPDTVRTRLAQAAKGIPECDQSGGMDALFGAPAP
ncbi:MAG: hypothetical protein ABI577_10810 [bacterium]